MPGFRPRPEYVGQMKRYGLLGEAFDAATGVLDVCAMDRACWRSFWYRPPP